MTTARDDNYPAESLTSSERYRARIAPFIPSEIPADLAERASQLGGFRIDVKPQSIAGHGITGRVEWAIRWYPNAYDREGYQARYRYGTTRDAASAMLRISEALDTMESERRA